MHHLDTLHDNFDIVAEIQNQGYEDKLKFNNY
jgi:hypothetical protein